MNPFYQLRDRLFLVCCSLYALNRWVIKPNVHNLFFDSYFNDLLLIPCALPPLLLIQGWLGLRKGDQPPSIREIAIYTVLWGILFEIIGPKIMPHTVGDGLDIVAYAIGAIIAALWWHRPGARSPSHAG